MCVHTSSSEVGPKGTIRACISINSYPQTERAVEYLLFFFVKSFKHPVTLLIEDLIDKYSRESNQQT